VEPEGVHRTTDSLPLTDSVVKHSKEVRDIPVGVVEYEYGRTRYQIFDIENELVAPSHPRDKKKWMAVVGVSLALVVVAGLGYIYVL
jgi:hypothetical protein